MRPNPESSDMGVKVSFACAATAGAHPARVHAVSSNRIDHRFRTLFAPPGDLRQALRNRTGTALAAHPIFRQSTTLDACTPPSGTFENKGAKRSAFTGVVRLPPGTSVPGFGGFYGFRFALMESRIRLDVSARASALGPVTVKAVSLDGDANLRRLSAPCPTITRFRRSS